MKYSVVIATHNRAADLRDTLHSLARLRPDGPWEAIVVDNNSSDATRHVIESAAAGFPARLRYLLEREQGRPSLVDRLAEFSKKLRAQGNPKKGKPVDKAFYDELSGDA